MWRTKDPEAVLDYSWDWRAKTNGTGDSDWLAEGETITTHTVTVTGATLDSSSQSAGKVTAWISAGTGVAQATCHITTSQGRQDDRTIRLHIQDR